MNKHNFLYSELIVGRSIFDWLFLLSGLIVQIIVFVLQPTNPWAIVSGVAGIFSVILCSQGKISTFFFGFIQITTYLYLSLVEHLYAEVAMNIFYFISQIYGLIVWKKRYKNNNNEVYQLQPKTMRTTVFALIFISSLLLSAITGWLLSQYTNDSQPYLDAFTTVPAIVAQVLLVTAYREQWWIWLFVDVFSVIMWGRAGNYSLMALYLFWCINCIYGYVNWNKNTSK